MPLCARYIHVATCSVDFVLCVRAVTEPVEERGQDTEEKRLETNERGLIAENTGIETDFEAKNNSCIYKDKAFTINVTKLARQFK